MARPPTPPARVAAALLGAAVLAFWAPATLAQAPTAAAAAPYGRGGPPVIQVRGAAGGAAEVQPGSVFTTVFRVLNASSEVQTVTPRLGSQLGWPSVMPLRPFAVRPRNQSVQVVSVQVPTDAVPGTYEVRYGVADLEDPTTFGVGAVSVTVPAVRSLVLEQESAPRLAEAGDAYAVQVLIVNTGNTAETVTLGATSNLGASLRLDSSRVRLRPGELRRLTVVAESDALSGDRLRHVVRLDARLDGDPEVAARLAVTTDLVPAAARSDASAEALRGEVAARGVRADGRLGGQVDASGAVPLWGGVVEGAVTLTDTERPSVYRDRSRASLRYAADGLAVQAGDHVFSLSPLTETGRFGFGGGAVVDRGALSGGAFYHQQRYGYADDAFGGGFVGVEVRPGAEIRANVLHRRGIRSGDAVTLRARAAHGRSAALDAECGVGTDATGAGGAARACSAEASLSHRLGSVRANVISADPGFPGHRYDVQAVAGSVVLQPTTPLRIEAALQDYRRGASFAGLTTGSYRVGTSLDAPVLGLPARLSLHRLGNRAGFAVDGQDRREDATRLAVSTAAGGVRLQGSAEVGRAEVEALGESGPFHRVRGRVQVPLPAGQSAHVGVEYRAGQALYPGAGQNGWRTTLGATAALTPRTRVSVTASAALGGVEVGAARRYLFAQTQAEHTLPSGHRLEARGRLLATTGPSATRLNEYSVSYVVPFAVSVRDRLSGAWVRGRVYDAETGEGLAGVAVTLGDHAALTDGDGVFVLPRPTEGTAYLRIDRVSAGIDRVPLPEMPMAVPGGVGPLSDVEIPMLRGARLTGAFRVDAEAAEPVRQAILELSGPSRRLRTVADRDGRFAFEGVPPGAWTLRVLHADLPRHHAVERDAYAVSLDPGGAGHVEIGVQRRRRQIQMIQSGTVTAGAPLRSVSKTTPSGPSGGR